MCTFLLSLAGNASDRYKNEPDFTVGWMWVESGLNVYCCGLFWCMRILYHIMFLLKGGATLLHLRWWIIGTILTCFYYHCFYVTDDFVLYVLISCTDQTRPLVIDEILPLLSTTWWTILLRYAIPLRSSDGLFVQAYWNCNVQVLVQGRLLVTDIIVPYLYLVSTHRE